MQLLNLQIKHARRIRLIFDQPLSIDAFLSVSYYSVVCSDGKASNPNVVQAFYVSNSPNVAELAFDIDLAQNSKYIVSAIGVPNSGNTEFTPDPSQLNFYFGQSTSPIVSNQNQGLNKIHSRLYGVDISMQNGEFIENKDGDLQLITGPEMVKEALWRRLLSNGLMWNSQYGLKSREFVDATPDSMPILATAADTQVRLDNRIQDVSVELDNQISNQKAFINITAKLKGAQSIDLQFSPPT
jgi:hypothetical protein